MTAMPIRMSAFGDITPEQELELAQELLNVQSEEELDNFLPLLLPAVKLAAPLLMKAAGPLLKTVAGSLLGGGRRRRRPRSEEEQFLGGLVGRLFGEQEAESEEEEQFIGKLLRGVIGGELEAEEEQFLGGLIGKLFGGELEAENYVQEQFIGGLIGKLFGRELETEYDVEAESDGERESEGELHRHRMRRARRFVRIAARASRRAARELVSLIQSGRRPTVRDARRIVFSAFLAAGRRLRSGGRGGPRPRLTPGGAGAAGARAPEPPPPGRTPSPTNGAPPQGETLLDRLTSGSRPLAEW